MLKVSDTTFNIFFDRYGNFYLKSEKAVHQLNIDGKNIPYFDTYDYKIIDHVKTRSTFNHSEKLFPCSDEPLFNLNDTDTETEMLYPEIEERYGYHNKPFKFYDNSHNMKIHDIKDSEICALYDTFIYENHKLMFISKSSDESSVYEVCIYDNNDILFKVLGEKETLFTIHLDEDLCPVLNPKGFV